MELGSSYTVFLEACHWALSWPCPSSIV